MANKSPWGPRRTEAKAEVRSDDEVAVGGHGYGWPAFVNGGPDNDLGAPRQAGGTVTAGASICALFAAVQRPGGHDPAPCDHEIAVGVHRDGRKAVLADGRKID